MSEEIWTDDLIGDRKQHADFLQNYLVSKGCKGAQVLDEGTTRSFVLNIDAGWGFGKTYFLKNFAQQLSSDHLVVTVDAWQHDYADDPLVPVLEALKKAVEPLHEIATLSHPIRNIASKGSALLGAIALGAAKQVARKAIGDAVEEISEIITGDAGETLEVAAEGGSEVLITKLEAIGLAESESFEMSKSLVSEFNAALQELVDQIDREAEQKLPIFVMIDELDRCRPTYAIQMLERIKHFFFVPGVVFVFATNTEQLCHSIKSVYGSEFDSTVYLQRFFERTYTFGDDSIKNFAKAVYADLQLHQADVVAPFNLDLPTVFADLCDSFGLGARDVKCIAQLLTDCVEIKSFKSPIVLPYFVFVAYALLFKKPTLLAPSKTLVDRSVERQLGEALRELGISLPFYNLPPIPGDRPLQVGMTRVIAHMLELRGISLSQFRGRTAEIHDAGPEGEWTVSQFLDEPNRENLQLVGGKFIPSIWAKYNDLILSAGRLT